MSRADALAAANRDSIANSGGRMNVTMPCRRPHWIEILLLDEYGNPVPHEEYLILEKNGQEHSGFLDENARARIEGLDPGSCEVSFPRLDKQEWRLK